MVKKIAILLLVAALAAASIFAEEGNIVEFAGEVTTGFQTDGDTNTTDVEMELDITVVPVEGLAVDTVFLWNPDSQAAAEALIDEFKVTGEFGTFYDLPIILTLEAGYFEAESSGYNVISGYEVEEILAGSSDEVLGNSGWSMALNLGYEADFGVLGVYGGAAIDTLGVATPASWMGGVYAELSVLPLNLEVFYDNAASEGDGVVLADASYGLEFGESTLELGLIEAYDLGSEENAFGFGAYFNAPLTDDIAGYIGATDIVGESLNTLYLEASAEFKETVGLSLGTVLAMGDAAADTFLGMDLGAYVYGGPLQFTVGYLIDTVDGDENPAALNAPGGNDTGGGFYAAVGFEF